MDLLQISLAAARVNAGLTQDEAAKAVHVTKQTLVNWELGRTEPTVSKFRELSDVYGIPVENIFLPSKSN